MGDSKQDRNVKKLFLKKIHIKKLRGKNKMNKTIIGMFSLFLVALFIVGCTQTPTGPTGQVIDNSNIQTATPTVAKQTIVIGQSAVLTGDLASLGQGAANSAALALSKLPADTKYNYKIILEDDRLDGKTAASIAQKFVTSDNVDAIISFSSGMGNVFSPITESNKIIHCGIASDKAIANGTYNFLHWTTPEEENKVMIRELKVRNVTRIGFLAMNQQGAIAILDNIRLQAEPVGIKVESQIYNPGEKDFKTILLKFQEQNVDYIVLQAFSPELEIFAKQYKELDVKTPMTSIESFEFSDQPQLFEGLWYVQSADATSEFRTNYKATYGKDFKPGSPNAYDCVNLIVKAYETAGNGKTKPAQDVVAKEFAKIQNFPGALGPLTVDQNHIVQSHAVVRVITNGTPITID
jgi:branched-chain amino acid transport system substrate-binding protein